MTTVFGGATLLALAFLGLVCAIVIAGEAVIAIVLAIYAAAKHLRMPALPDIAEGERIAHGYRSREDLAREAQYDPALHQAPNRRAFK